MKESLAKVTDVVSWYKGAKSASPLQLTEALRVLTSHLYTLEQSRAEYKLQYEQIIFGFDGPVNRAVNEAEIKVPELYMLRRIMDASYRVADSMRTQISFLKYEMEHTKTEV